MSFQSTTLTDELWDTNMFKTKLMPLVEANRYKLNWWLLSENPAAIRLLEANPKKIYWQVLSGNPAAIHLLEANPEKIYWPGLSANPAAIHLLEANPEKINWWNLSMNPSIFTYDYAAIKTHMYGSGLARDLMENRFHPRNVHKFEEWGHEGIF